METDFAKILTFFQTRQAHSPGDQEYDAAFCHSLIEASPAREASIWRLDSEHRLHMVYGTNVPPEELSQIMLHEGEGISGAAVLSRKTIAVSDAFTHPQHNNRVDHLLGFPTHAMISAPIIFNDNVYGVINILNSASGDPFSPEWQDYLSAAATMYGAALGAAGRLATFITPKGKKELEAKGPPKHKRSKTVVIGVSPAVQEALLLCLKSSRMEMPVLVRGETGSGKELAARRIHEASNRAEGPFVEVNCAALTETLLESELFGHVKGAFSGANYDRKGKFLTASEGTLFLDEIGDMSLSCQAKILRALQDKKVTPVGSDKTRDCDARVIAATNYDLLDQVRKGKFREDLYYRLCGIEITMPPLRERREDIYPLAMHFLNKIDAEQKKIDPLFKLPKISQNAANVLNSFDWPGNVRQLEQAIRAAVAICEGDEIGPGDFPSWLQDALKTDQGCPASENLRFAREPTPIEASGLSDEESLQYMEALEETKYSGTGRWNLTAASRRLNIPRKTFTYRLKKMNIMKR